MKKICVALLSACSLLAISSCNKSSEKEEYKIITVNNVKYLTYKAPEVEPVAMVVGYAPEIAEVVEIPNSVEGYTVNSIRSGSFEDASFSKVTIPDTVLYIGPRAFMNCEYLQEINLSPNITTIYEETFFNCNNLESINIPSGVYTIENNAFENCLNLTSVVFSGTPNITNIYQYAFCDCVSLESIDFSKANNLQYIPDWCFSGCYSLTSVILPTKTYSIGTAAFEGCSSLSSIEIPANIASIYDEAFIDCSSLKQIFLPQSLSYLGSDVFKNCHSTFKILFESSDLPFLVFDEFNCGYPYVMGAKKETKVDDVFITENDIAYCVNDYSSNNPTAMLFKSNNEKITSVNVPKEITFQNTKKAKVTTIEDKAFKGYKDLTTVDLTSDTLNSIGNESFSNTSIAQVTLGANINNIGEGAFSNCLKLEKVDMLNLEVPEGGKISIGATAFYYDYNLKEVVFPTSRGNINIEPGTFSACRKLASITNLDKIVNIKLGGYTFYECYTLGSVKTNPFKFTNNFKMITNTDFGEWGTVNPQYIEIAKDAYEKNAGGTVSLHVTNEKEEIIVLSPVDDTTYKNNEYFGDAIITLESKS